MLFDIIEFSSMFTYLKKISPHSLIAIHNFCPLWHLFVFPFLGTLWLTKLLMRFMCKHSISRTLSIEFLLYHLPLLSQWLQSSIQASAIVSYLFFFLPPWGFIVLILYFFISCIRDVLFWGHQHSAVRVGTEWPIQVLSPASHTIDRALVKI